MVIHLSQTQYQQIEQAVSQAYPREGCGLLLGRRRVAQAPPAIDSEADHREVTAVIPVENAWHPSLLEYTDLATEIIAEDSHSQRDRYWIDPAVLLKTQQWARTQGIEIIGIYHSHPDHAAVPSECDRRLAWPVYSYLIASVVNGDVVDLQSWRLNEAEQFQPEPVKIFGSSASKPSFLS